MSNKQNKRCRCLASGREKTDCIITGLPKLPKCKIWQLRNYRSHAWTNPQEWS